MKRFLAFALLPTLLYAQSNVAPSSDSTAPPPASLSPNREGAPLPKGKSTVIGGTVTKLDLVRDELTVRVFGSKQTMKIFFDPRTRIFRDASPVAFNQLHNGDHVSLETRLDGTDVFAMSIHVFAGSTTGECKGQVLSYDAGKGELIVRDGLAPQPVKLQVSSATPISGAEKGPSYSIADLKEGALVSAQFSTDDRGRHVARQLTIQAVRGATFSFSGSVTYLDLHSGVLVLTDPRDKKTYEISFDPHRASFGEQLREGSDVTVAALFDGSHYRATDVTVNPSSK
jgi:hypothetical protein